MKKSKVRAAKVKRVVEQIKEPLSLLDTLKEEGMARAMFLLSAASSAAQNIKKEKVVESLKEGIQTLGLVTKADYDALVARLNDVEERLLALEGGRSDEDE